MKKIVLVNPPSSLEVEFGVLAAGGSYRPPLQLATLAACLREAGIEVSILDCLALNLGYQQVLERILQSGAEYVGITATTLTIHNAAKLAKRLKEARPDLKTIIGGVHATLLPQDTLKRFPHFDLLVVGEGEQTLPQALETWDKKGSWADLPGIAYRHNGDICLTERRPFINKLDTLPFPAWDLLPNLTQCYQPAMMRHVRLPSAYILTARGCPFRCSFCAGRAVMGRTYRSHSVDYITKMIKALIHDYNIKDLTIYDEVLTLNKKRLYELCDRLIAEKLDLTWSCDARVDTVDYPLLKRMSEAGCRNISYGIESGSQEVLDGYRKGITVEQIEKALCMSKKAGIATSGFFMFGAPNETKKTMQETIDLLKRVDLDFFTPFFFGPQPGDAIYEKASQYGWFDNDWTKMNGVNLIFIPNGLTRQDMESYFKKALFAFYLRPRTIIGFIKRADSLGYFWRLVKGAVALLQIYLKRNLSKGL
jgi:radical SAM superfamily enzyme YgiQ (UPF0313 family)